MKLILAPGQLEGIDPSHMADNLSENECTLICDASYKGGIAGVSVQIITNKKSYGPYQSSLRTKGPIHSELTAVYKGLSVVAKFEGINSVFVYTDCNYAWCFLQGFWKPQRPYIKGLLEKIKLLKSSVPFHIFFFNVKAKAVKKIDREAHKARRKEEEKNQQRIQERVIKVEEAIIRGRQVEIIENEENGEKIYYARPKEGGFGKGFRVSLAPLSCECKGWIERWKNVPQAGRNARRLPCKHICALAEYLGVNIFDLFQKQIERTN